MLKHWQTHAEYQHFISEAVALLNPSQLKKLYSMFDSWNKLTSHEPLPCWRFPRTLLFKYRKACSQPDTNSAFLYPDARP